MDKKSIWITVTVVFLVVLTCAIIQSRKYLPDIFTETLDTFLGKMTIGSLMLLMVFVYVLPLSMRIREGFANEPTDPIKTWGTMVNTYGLKDLCAVIQAVQAKMAVLEKGAPPEQLTDDQARELVKANFAANIPSGPFSCSKFNQLNVDSDTDRFYMNIQGIPDTYLVQAYETAVYCQKQYATQLDTVKKSLNVKNAPTVDLPLESFADMNVCSPEVSAERRKFQQEKKLQQEAQLCILPEEVPTETKEKQITDKLNKLNDEYLKYIAVNNVNVDIPSIVAKCQKLALQIEDYGNKAQSGALVKDIKT